MKRYHQISLKEREKIYLAYQNGQSMRQISIKLGRNVSSISREIKRNSCQTIGYSADRADKFAKDRANKNILKIEKYPKLKTYIIERLKEDKWPPEAISGVLRLGKNDLPGISHESIYQFIYSKEGQKRKLYQHLMYKRPQRQAKFSRTKRYKVPESKRITVRPEEINKRTVFGHAEGDLTFFAGSQSSNIITTMERVSRIVKIAKNPNKTSISTSMKLSKICKDMGYKSLTIDNGSEFTNYGAIELSGCEVYFCNPHSPWEKGSIERMHVFLHKFIPKKTNINDITAEKLQWAEDKLNNLPRKCLDYLTPKMLYDKLLKQGSVALET
jgi:IS30 family transposase